MTNYLNEAFKKLSVLDEDIFEMDDDGISALKDFTDEDEKDDSLAVIDMYADDKEELEDSYVGKVVCDCCVCHSKVFWDKENIELDDDGELVNVGSECPYCYATDGFKIVGEVKEYCPECDDEHTEDNHEEEKEDSDVEVEIKDKEEITESVSKKDDIDAEADDRKERLKKFIAKRKDSIDADKDYRLKKGITRRDESCKEDESCEKESCKGKAKIKGKRELKEAPIYDLKPQFDSRQSFYGKAKVDTGDTNDKNRLYSYDTLVAEIKDGKPVIHTDNKFVVNGRYSPTTMRHIKDWLLQNGFKAETSKQIMSDYGEKKNESCKESIDSISVDTGDQIIDVTAKDKDEPVEEHKDGDEVLGALSDETKSEIIDKSEGDYDDVDVDIDEFEEEDFDELGESYLKRAYENVDKYRTSKISMNKDNLIVEGIITFKSGKQKKTNFVLESKNITKDGTAKFIGENSQICKGRKAFTVCGKIDGKKFLPESLNYNYRAKDANTGIVKRIYGTVKVGNKAN